MQSATKTTKSVEVHRNKINRAFILELNEFLFIKSEMVGEWKRFAKVSERVGEEEK